MDVLFWILAGMFIGLGVIGALILRAQKKLDAPPGGLLLVDKREDTPAVYFQALRDPGTFTDGEEIRLKVVVVDESKARNVNTVPNGT